MIDALESLSRSPGVRLAALVTTDGVPVAVPGDESRAGDVDVDAVAAVASHWLDELGRTLGGLTMAAPTHAVLSAARGTLLLMHSPGSVLIALADPSVDRVELRLQMEAAVARIGRSLRSLGDRASVNRPSAALPGTPKNNIDSGIREH